MNSWDERFQSELMAMGLEEHKYDDDDDDEINISGKLSLRSGMEDIDFMESGQARETLRDSHLCPLSARTRNVMCYVLREGKDCFWLYQEADSKFLLSAKRVDDDFYISQYHEFPYHFGPMFTGENVQLGGSGAMGASYCSALRLAKNKQYVLYNRVCECCDGVLGRHTCGPHTQSNGDRQILATMRHYASSVRTGNTAVDCNAVKVNLPIVHDDYSRDVWCPRATRMRARSNSIGSTNNAHPQPGKLERQTSSSSVASDVSLGALVVGRSKPRPGLAATSTRCGKTEKLSQEPNIQVGSLGEVDAIVVDTKRPRYDRCSGSLRMKFFDNRVIVASSKNLIFGVEESNSDRGILQFGKASHNRFNLDFRYPLAPVQAFAIGLSLFNWQGPSQK